MGRSARTSSPFIASWAGARSRVAARPPWSLAAEGQIVGVLYGFWWRDTFAAYQQGWDREFARDALGNVLVLHALEFATEHGARTFDFLRGTEPYKYRFGARDESDLTWLVPRGRAGVLLERLRPRRGRPAAAPRPSG